MQQEVSKICKLKQFSQEIQKSVFTRKNAKIVLITKNFETEFVAGSDEELQFIIFKKI